MILKLLESRRARHFAGGALAASVGVHLGAGGMASRPGPARRADAPEPISVRYLIPPNRGRPEPVERINWAVLGPGTDGWQRGDRLASAALPVRGDDGVAEASRVTEVPVLPEPAFEPSVTYQEFEVDSAATRDPASAGPEYPDALRLKGVQGEVVVEFAVDSTGHADEGTFKVIESTHPEFSQAVRDALPRMLFHPAVTQGRRVRQLVRLPMKFKLLTAPAEGST